MSEDQVEEDFNEHEEEEQQPQKAKKKGFVGMLMAYVPMFLLSVTLHLLLLFVISLIPAESSQEEEQVTIITVFEEEEEVEEEIEEIEKIELEVEQVEVEPVETEVSPVQEEVLDIVDEPMEELDDSLDELMDLIPDDVSTQNDVSSLAVMGLSGGASGSSGLPSGYSKRSGKAKSKAVKRGGGDAKTEAAVDAALQWLALHQEEDGSWHAEKYEGHGVKGHEAITAAALLPFLGAGHTEMAGKYKKTVRAGVRYLNDQMKNPKMFKKPHFHNNYGTALGLMALAETSLFGSSPTTKKNANRIAEYFIEQYMKDPGSGWLYGSAGDDFSVSGWIALGLKSAKAADLDAMKTKDAKTVFKKYKDWTHKVMCLPKTGLGLYREPGGKHGNGQGRIHMGWVGMFQKQFLGFPRNDPFLKKASEVTIEYVKKGTHVGNETPGDVYGIYYGTLSAFQQQGAVWDAWNPAMKKTIVLSQKTGNPKELGGSWDPTKGHTAEKGGRVLTTALMALCLEVYYRYDMMN